MTEFLPLVFVALRGFLLVAAVSWQTINLLSDSGTRVVIGAALVSVLWWLNVMIVIDTMGLSDMAAYTAGSSAGALLGWRLKRWHKSGK